MRRDTRRGSETCKLCIRRRPTSVPDWNLSSCLPFLHLVSGHWMGIRQWAVDDRHIVHVHHVTGHAQCR